VAAADLVADAAQAVAAEIVAAGGRASAHALDVADPASIARVVASLPGPVDLLVASAGLQHVAPIERFEATRFRQLVDVMLTGSALMAAAVLPGMRTAGRGRIILARSTPSSPHPTRAPMSPRSTAWSGWRARWRSRPPTST
jgi:3-hydroxybutyrate dehydrogenase